MNKKIIVTKLDIDMMQPATLFAIYEDNKAQKVELFYEDDQYVLGNIYVAHVNDLVKNINAAFVEYTPGHKGYLSLTEHHNVFFTNRKNTTKICEGDNILIQVKKEPIKTKDAVVSTNIEYSGKYVVLTYGKADISVSSKITDISMRDNLKKIGESFMASIDFDKQEYPLFTEEIFLSILHGTGIIFRTECGSDEVLINHSLIREELAMLFKEFLMVFHKAMSAKGRTLIKQAENPIITMTKAAIKNADNIDIEVITDAKELFDTLQAENINARLYLDELLPLYKLYSVESVLNEITSKKIWLKSGGYLIIEYTEAMTVIDVNTGKCEQGKDKEKTIMKINSEAADEILRQLRLRNISGIIVVDFIDMKSEDYKKQLMRQLKSKASEDDIRTIIVDMTQLNLVEITRKKTRERIKIKKRNSYRINTTNEG